MEDLNSVYELKMKNKCQGLFCYRSAYLEHQFSSCLLGDGICIYVLKHWAGRCEIEFLVQLRHFLEGMDLSMATMVII